MEGGAGRGGAGQGGCGEGPAPGQPLLAEAVPHALFELASFRFWKGHCLPLGPGGPGQGFRLVLVGEVCHFSLNLRGDSILGSHGDVGVIPPPGTSEAPFPQRPRFKIGALDT